MKRIGLLAVLMFAVAAAPAQVKFGAGPQAGFSFASFPKPADELYGFGYDFAESFARRVQAVTREDVQRVAMKYFTKRALVTVTSAPQKKAEN